VLAVSVLCLLSANAAEFTVASTVEPPEARSGETVALKVDFAIGEGIYLYRDKLSFVWETIEGATLGDVVLPSATKTIPDPLDDQGLAVSEVYEGSVTVKVPLTVTAAPGTNAVARGVVQYQGCTDTYCFRPMKEALSFEIPVSGTSAVAGAGNHSSTQPAPARPPRTEADRGLLLRLVMAFGTGILISLTPCVYPMIPITAAIIGGVRKPGEGRGNVANALSRSVAYVLGLAIVYAMLGVLSATLGGAFSRWLKTAWVLVPVASVFVLFALSMFEVITIQTPGFIRNRFAVGGSGKSLGRAFVFGIVAGFVATPCTAAPLAGILTLIATTGDRVLGFWMLFALAWGMGLVLIAVGTFSGSVLPKAGPWMVWLKKLFGFIMLWAGAYFLQPVTGVEVYRVVSSVIIIAAAVFLGGLDALSETSGFGDRLKRVAGIVVLILAALSFVGSAGPLIGVKLASPSHVGESGPSSFTPADSRALDKALGSGRPTVVEFYAEWCVLCKKLERKTLTSPAVVEALAGVNALKVDIDRHPSLQQEYNVIGPPSLLFFDGQGREHRESRITGVVGPDEVVAAIREIALPTRG
jgi:thiol:disulfide interchange protein DsbD